MTQPQKAAAEVFRAQLVALHEGCVKKGGYTPDAAAFLDSRGGENLLPAADIEVKERFGIGEAGASTSLTRRTFVTCQQFRRSGLSGPPPSGAPQQE